MQPKKRTIRMGILGLSPVASGQDAGPDGDRGCSATDSRRLRAEPTQQGPAAPMRRRLLTLAAVAPLIVLAAGLTFNSFNQQQAVLRDQAARQVGDILNAVERDLVNEVRSLQGLASSPSLDGPSPSLDVFHAQASRFREQMKEWDVVVLADPAGRQVVNTRLPPGAPLPGVADDESYRRVVATRQPAIGNLSGPGPLAGDPRPRVSIRVAVARDGELRYVLTAVISPERLSRVIGHGINPEWRSFLIDGAGRIAASDERPDAIGQRPSDQTLAARAASVEGIYEGTTLDGAPTVTAFKKSNLLGWSAHVSIPRAAYDAPMTRFLWYMAGSVALALALASTAFAFLRREAVQRQLYAGAVEAARKSAERIGASLELRDRSLAAIAQRVVITDARSPDNQIIYTNPAFERLTGYSDEEAAGRNCRFLQGAETDPKALARIRSALQSGQVVQETLVNRRKDGSTFVNELTISPVRGPDGTVTHFVGTQSDVTERQRLEERLRLALRAGRMVAWEQDLETNYITRSQNSMELLGIGSGLISEFLERLHPDDRGVRERFMSDIEASGAGTIEFRYMLPGGGTMWFGARAEKAGPRRIVGISFDISDRKAAEEKIWRAANHDHLTGLPNRTFFQARFEQALARARQNGTSVSLILIDLDDFKDVNDTLGHDAGDASLKEIAARLSAMMRDCDLVARLGGDEFAVLVVEPLELEHAARFAEFLIETLREPCSYAGRTIVSRASVGVAAFPNHSADPRELMKAADIALYRAKGRGRNRVVKYSAAMRMEIEERVSLAAEISDAVGKDRIVAFYQPKISLATGRIVGFEALARWLHPTKGVLTPQVFGSMFTDYDIAAAIGGRLLGKVAGDMRRWLDSGLDPGRVAVNLSAAEFSNPGIATEVLRVLSEWAIPTGNFEVEVTETVLLGRSADGVAAILKKFHDRGVMVALDDFGTGYASLTHLKQFPVDHVKIDQSFVRDMEEGVGDEAIIAAVIGLARGLSLQVTAEGVETLGQAARLRELGCHNAQGYLVAKPMPGSEVADFISAFQAGPLAG